MLSKKNKKSLFEIKIMNYFSFRLYAHNILSTVYMLRNSKLYKKRTSRSIYFYGNKKFNIKYKNWRYICSNYRQNKKMSNENLLIYLNERLKLRYSYYKMLELCFLIKKIDLIRK
jgi:hypothetical protein